MSALAASAVSLYPTGLGFNQYYPVGKGDTAIIARRLKLVLTGQGTAANPITSEALGFSTLLEVQPLWDAANTKGYPAVIDPVNDLLILLDGSAAPAPVDVTSAESYITVVGIWKGFGIA